MKKIIFYELNEVPPLILKRFIEKYSKSALAKVYEKGNFFVTKTPDQGKLSPWITWPTLYRGVNNTKHLINDLNLNLLKTNSKYPNYFNILAQKGFYVGVFGSLHTYPPPKEIKKYAFYIPDTFSKGFETYPSYIQNFQKLNLYMTSINGRNVKKYIPYSHVFKLIFELPKLGIRFKTLISIILHLFAEKLKPALIVRRRSIQTKLSFDIFFKLLTKTKPDLVTFFTNHVASSIHRYWPAAFPNDFKKFTMSNKWNNQYKNEIWFTLREADKQINKLLSFIKENSNYVLIIASSMGQEPVQNSKMIANQLFLKSPDKFFSAFNINKNSWVQNLAMEPEYIFKFNTKNNLELCVSCLNKLRILNKKIIYKVLNDNSLRINFGQKNIASESCKYRSKKINFNEIGLEAISIQDKTGSFAYHVPEGILLIFNGASKKGLPKLIMTDEIAPSILKNFKVKRPVYMKNGYKLI